MDEVYIPQIDSKLRHIVHIPKSAREATGIIINGRKIRSLIFSTDIAVIRNCDADAVFAVYPFTPQQAISNSIISQSYIPVFCGVGGGTTNGARSVVLAKDAEAQGAMGIVLNAPVTNENLKEVSNEIFIPVIITVANENTDIQARIDNGASILNVACAKKTPDVVRRIRKEFPTVPIIASGGPTEESIRETIRAGANAVTYTPPSVADLFTEMMNKYRET